MLAPRVGLAALTGAEGLITWPEWQAADDRVAATVHVPFGWRRLLGSHPIEIAPLSLMDRILGDRSSILELTPPFALLSLDARTATLDVVNDGLGYVRLYVLEDAAGMVLSSRLGAIPIFRGYSPSSYLRGWQSSGAAGWFMGDATPIEGIVQLSPGTHLHASPRKRPAMTQFDAIKVWTEPRDGSPEDGDATREQLLRYADDVGEVWAEAPSIQLSGGRDSRAAAAGFVARRVPATFRTVASLDGELKIARQLLKRVGRSADHVVVRERDVSATGDIRERAASLHRAFDGVYGPAGLRQPKMRGFGARRPTVTGAAGEIARGNFYKGAILDTIVKRGSEGPFLRLDRLYAVYGGVNADARATVSEAIRRALQLGLDDGLEGPALLDYFYLTERLRRWANTSSRIGTLTPLATPAYVRAAFDQSPEAKLDERFHLGVITSLVPEWRGVGFYKAKPADTARMTRPRMWATDDRLAVAEVLDGPERWNDVFDATAIRELWAEVIAGEGVTRHETVLQRLIWRATYEDHLAVLAIAARAEPSELDAAAHSAEGGWLRMRANQGLA